MKTTRKQLTLFIDESTSHIIENFRKEFNPLQYHIIKSHVTLCREDELEQIEKICLNLRNIHTRFITIHFGNIIRFANNKGLMIPAFTKNSSFIKLRKNILQNIIEKPSIQEPHITLIHPRNGTCTNEIFKQMENHCFPSSITFKKVSLIEQEIGKPWNILEEFELKN